MCRSHGIGVAALKDDTLKTFPIIKEVNNNTNTFVQHVAIMKKTDDPAYATHNGWLYTQHTRQAESAKFIAGSEFRIRIRINGMNALVAFPTYKAIMYR